MCYIVTCNSTLTNRISVLCIIFMKSTAYHSFFHLFHTQISVSKFSQAIEPQTVDTIIYFCLTLYVDSLSHINMLIHSFLFTYLFYHDFHLDLALIQFLYLLPRFTLEHMLRILYILLLNLMLLSMPCLMSILKLLL